MSRITAQERQRLEQDYTKKAVDDAEREIVARTGKTVDEALRTEAEYRVFMELLK